MTRFMSRMLLCAFLLLLGRAALCTGFDEHLWEKYAEIETSSVRNRGSLAGVYLEPRRMGDVSAKAPFADLRVITDRKEEVPWQIVSERPEKRTEEIPAQMRNLSQNGKGETWLELVIDRPDAHVNAVEVITPDSGFSRQVQVFGSPDGKSWSAIRKDEVIFDINRGEKFRHTRIAFPLASFPHLALKIINGDSQPLTITGVKALQDSDSPGNIYTIPGTAEKSEDNAARQENSIVVRMSTVFPLDRLHIATTEHNFQRSVEVQIRQGTGEWMCWARGIIFDFDTPAIHASQLTIGMPEVAAGEFRLVFRNLDSPPLPVTYVNGEGYRRLLVFKQQPDKKLYLFWGNPLAQQPRYDLAGLVAQQRLDALPIAFLGQVSPNAQFAGNKARLPFTERYKYPLYVVMIMAIAGLVFLQYRVLRRVGE